MSSSFPDHFSGVAEHYAEFRPEYPGALFDYLAALSLPEGPVWDCAAGNGQATRGLARRFARVIATDASADQIAAATPLSGVEFRVALSEASGLADTSVGLVTVAQALHWFDLPRFYTEVRRVLRPAGVVAVWAYGINRVEGDAVDAVVQDFYSNILGPYWPSSRRLVESGYRTLPFPFQEVNPPAFAMEQDWSLQRLLGYFGTWSATTRYIKATGEDPLQALRPILAEAWGDPTIRRRVIWPIALRVGVFHGA